MHVLCDIALYACFHVTVVLFVDQIRNLLHLISGCSDDRVVNKSSSQVLFIIVDVVIVSRQLLRNILMLLPVHVISLRKYFGYV